MVSPKRRIGNIGEDVICGYLVANKYRVLERNYWKPWGEIDIVAEKGKILCFVEVKSISYGAAASIRPEENFHSSKMKKLGRVIDTYLLERKISKDRPWQIDLACVVLDLEGKRGRVKYFDNVIL